MQNAQQLLSMQSQRQLMPMQQQMMMHAQPQQQQQFNQQGQFQSYGYDIPGLREALFEALTPVAHMDNGWGLEEMVRRVQSYFTKAAKKFENDDRLQARGTAVEARALIEDLVSTAMGAVAAACYDKVWFMEADFSGALMVVTMHTIGGAKVLCRTLGPLLKRYIDDSVFKYKEEERVQKVMWDAIVGTGLNDNYHKRINKALLAAYDEAHMNAHYGECLAQSAEVGSAMAFIKFWIEDFADKSWDIIEAALVGNRQARYAFLAGLFHYMTDPQRSILPHEVLRQLLGPVPQNWDFIDTQVHEVVNKLEQAQVKRLKRF